MSPEARAQAEKWGWDLPPAEKKDRQALLDDFLHGSWVKDGTAAAPPVPPHINERLDSCRIADLPPVEASPTQAEVDAFIHGAWVNGGFVATPAQTCATTQSQPTNDAQMAALVAICVPEKREPFLAPLPSPEKPHCPPDLLLDAEQYRAMAWERMVADLPSADPPTDHGCRLANYIARQERRRNWTLTHSRRVNRGDEGAE